MGRIVVVGLGPGDPSLITSGTRDAIDRSRPEARFLRTAVHPSAHLVPGARTFDHHYEAADTFDEVYRLVVDDLVAAADDQGEVLYAVPGSPRVLERTVDLLDAAAAAGRVDLRVVPAMSFVDLVWARLGIDPFESGVRLVDGHRFEVAAAGQRGPLLVAHCHNARVLSDIKLAVAHPPGAQVTILQRLGLPDESVTSVDWADLDRSVTADHLTSVYIPELVAPVAGEVAALAEVVTRLRAECPWDADQTHRTLARHLIEETYEVLEALDAVGDGGPDVSAESYRHLEEELGDLLFQIAFHATLAAEEGAFDLSDVARGIREKLVHRHPHVFADVEVADADDVVANWEAIKKAEKGRDSVFDGIPVHLPALLYALKVHKKASTFGVEPLDADHLGPGPSSVGDRLLGLVVEARALDVDPEAELRAAATRLRDRARAVEAELPFSPPAPGVEPPS